MTQPIIPIVFDPQRLRASTLYSAAKLSFKALPPLALYIHFPWCVKKCPYCDFNSHQVQSSFDEIHYVDCLLQELESHLPRIWGRAVSSIFMGGGTPSLFSGAAIDRLIQGLRARLVILPEAEITLEANPNSADKAHFQRYREAGVNRLSIGVQSFNAAHLESLGRAHTMDEAVAAVHHARRYFDRVNADIMYALPNQSLAAALADIEIALDLGVTHLSAYQLTLEPNTPFFAHPPNLPDDDTSMDMQEAIEARLARAGFMHYETSAFALPDQHSRHNVNYWQFGDYLGIGAGAHSKITSHDGIVRMMSHKSPKAYLEAASKQRSFTQTEHAITAEALPGEFMMNALRLIDGFDTQLFYERTSLSWVDIEPMVQKAIDQGLLCYDARQSPIMRPSPQGARFLNTLLTLFL
jgi:oxygen-independent coproporphyrinogen-3 oxidase